MHPAQAGYADKYPLAHGISASTSCSASITGTVPSACAARRGATVCNTSVSQLDTSESAANSFLPVEVSLPFPANKKVNLIGHSHGRPHHPLCGCCEAGSGLASVTSVGAPYGAQTADFIRNVPEGSAGRQP
jgi:triacylglycerol lipase